MGTRQRRRREAGERRAEILRAARELFWTRGYERTTMPQIAEKTELAPGTLYLYFRGKRALYAEILAEGYDLLHERLAEAGGAHGPAREQAEAMIDAFFDFARHQAGYFDMMFLVLQRQAGGWQHALSPEQIQRLLAKEEGCKSVAGKALARIWQDKAAAGEVGGVDAIWSMLGGVVFFFRHEANFDAIAAEAKRLVLAGVFAGR